jgi:hypothetical protein
MVIKAICLATLVLFGTNSPSLAFTQPCNKVNGQFALGEMAFGAKCSMSYGCLCSATACRAPGPGAIGHQTQTLYRNRSCQRAPG